MRQAMYLPPIGNFGDVHLLVDLAVRAENHGWDGFFLWDHVHYEPPAALADTWLALAAIAGATSTIRLGPLITPLPRRRPWKVAREAVTLDHLSRGRLVLGVGLGIDYWREFSAFGEVDSDVERAALLDDGIDILRALWAAEPVSHKGRRLAIDDVEFLPGPAQPNGIPIWSAVGWPASRSGPLDRAARCDGVMPFSGAEMTPEQAAEVHDNVAQRRDSPFDLCVWGDRNRAAAYQDAGVTWLVQAAWPDTAIDEVQATIDAGPASI